MKIFSKLLLSLLVWALAASSFSACSPKPQNDCGFVQNIYGERVSWKSKKARAIKLYIHSSVPKELRPAVYRAAQTWETQAGHKIFEISEDSTQLSATPSRDQKNAIYFLSEWESDRPSEQGRTSIFWTGDEIQEADIRINASNFSYYDQNPQQLIGSYGAARNIANAKVAATGDGYSFEALLLHEMGHFLGLKHREGSTVMATHLAAFTNRTQLAVEDAEAISCEYK
jgi:hypothetical protein